MWTTWQRVVRLVLSITVALSLTKTYSTDSFQPLPIEHYNYFKLMTRFYFNYSMLVVNSFGLQNALERSKLDVGHFFGRCYSSAMACALLIRDEIGPQGFLRYSPDSHFVLSSYAVLTLLKVSLPHVHHTGRDLNILLSSAHPTRVSSVYGE